MSDGSEVYKLQCPIQWDTGDGEKTVTEVKINRPKGKHIKQLGGDMKLKDVMKIMHHLTDYTDKFFDELDGADYLGVAEVVMDFLDSGR